MIPSIMRKQLILVLLALAAYSSESSIVYACSCGVPAPPCQAYRDASAVFVGTVTDVSTTSVEEEIRAVGKGREKSIYQEKVFRFSLEQIYKGIDGFQAQVQTGPALGGDCGYAFEKGERYLVYASRDSKTGMLHTSICSRTTAVSQAGDDLGFLRGLPDSASKTRISGTVIRYTNEHDKTGFRMIQPLASVRVIVSSQGRQYEAITNDDGVYQLVDLPPGSYEIEADLPGNLSRSVQTVRLAQGNCAQANIVTKSNGGIGGKVIDNEGQAVAGIKLDLIPVDVIDLENGSQRVIRSHSERTDKEGRYSFQNIPPGRYYFGFNLVYEARTDYPYPRTYFPGTSDRAQAIIMSLRDGEQLAGIDFALPGRMAVRKIQGVFLWSDGRPVTRGHILLKDAKDAIDTDKDYRIFATAEVDQKGQFSIEGFEGVQCWLHGWAMEGQGFFHAEPIMILVNNGVQPVRLIIKKQDKNRNQHNPDKKP